MTESDYRDFFRRATGGQELFPYQMRLALGEWPELLDVPTGLGKTAAVVVAWVWRRHHSPGSLPRRLVWCLPTRALVSQVSAAVEGWLSRVGELGEPGETGKVSVHCLMGGETEAPWAEFPDEAAVVVGTQDQLLSRALMRGYSMSRYLWPVHFALLHNDALWVFDEVQLMGAGVATSAQLEAFRRSMGSGCGSRSLWLSATLESRWLETVDFRIHRDSLIRCGLEDADRGEAAVVKRLSAVKRLRRADASPAGPGKTEQEAYFDALAAEVRECHSPGTNTLVILNQVGRAQALAARLHDAGVAPLLLHGRFRRAERLEQEQLLEALRTRPGRIIVATQTVEAGVDISSGALFTELAPWASLVQRFGRCNRYGEVDEAQVRWIDLGDEKLAPPYGAEALMAARGLLEGLSDVGTASLAHIEGAFGERPAGAVLRRKDLLELFNTDPDLSGFDVDVAPLIRESDGPGMLQLFWRDLSGGVREEPFPAAAELCSVSLGQFAEYLGTKMKSWERCAYRWDGQSRSWQREKRPRPGMRLMLDARLGGYDPLLGFLPSHKEMVPVEARPVDLSRNEEECAGGDPLSRTGRFVPLDTHLDDAVAHASRLAEVLANEWLAVLTTAARWHDAGKSHPAFQNMLLVDPADGEARERVGRLWAKGLRSKGLPTYATCELPEEKDAGRKGRIAYRLGFRHELASMLAWLAHGDASGDEAFRDLVAYLVAAHHGKVRMGLRALPSESEPPDTGAGERRYARGVWEGDRLPAMELGGGVCLPETALRLSLMELGGGEGGEPSWSARTQGVLERLGPFRLAWLEALVRIADWRASKESDMEETA